MGHPGSPRCSLPALVFVAALLAPGLPLTDHLAVAQSARTGKRAGTTAKRTPSSCLRELKRLGVKYSKVKRKGIEIAVRVRGDIGGVRYRGYNKKKSLDLDCSLVVTLAHMGPYLTAQGIQRATYSSAYQRRRVRGTSRWSKHSFGLALDIHEFSGDKLDVLRVKDDYEQGLGDDQNCIGTPLTPGGTILRTLHCQFRDSGRFHSILTPDYDAGHYNHFHVEADPWSRRTD